MSALRLIDLHCNWLCQYAAEATTFDAAVYSAIAPRLGQLDGYLLGTAAAVLSCGRLPGEWACHPDRWRSLTELLARYEAEFTGRIIMGPDDVARWRAEPHDGLCWGMLGVAGFDFLVREPADIDRLPGLFERGVRVFQLVDGSASALAGSAEPGDDRGLTNLGHSCLEALAELAGQGPGPKPILDLAHLNPRAMAEVLEWLHQNAVSPRGLFVAYSHGATSRDGFDTPRTIGWEHVARLRSAGGVIGVTPSQLFYATAEEFRADLSAIAEVPFEGRPGYEGIALGTDFLGSGEPLPELRDVGRLIGWLTKHFDQSVATSLISKSGRRLMVRAAGVESD